MIEETLLNKKIKYPKYGLQDKGISPGGCQDTFSYQSCKVALDDCNVYEILHPTKFIVPHDRTIIFTGGKREISINGNSIKHRTIYNIYKDDVIEIGNSIKGLITYLGVSKYKSYNIYKTMYYQRNWIPKIGTIRIVGNTESDRLDDINILENKFKISRDISNMGIRLDNISTSIEIDNMDMISECVSTGTIQLTKSGLIILMSGRQTIGGYPKVANVISADVDLLAQYKPGDSISFKFVNIEDAHNILKEKQKSLKSQYFI